MMEREEIMQLLEEEESLTADGFDECIIGAGSRCGQPTLAVYSVQKIIETLVERDGMTYEDAVEHFNFNIVGAWVGPKTPIFVEMIEE